MNYTAVQLGRLDATELGLIQLMAWKLLECGQNTWTILTFRFMLMTVVFIKVLIVVCRVRKIYMFAIITLNI